jgi:hypothetical protein
VRLCLGVAEGITRCKAMQSCFLVGTRCTAANSRLSGRGEDPVGRTGIASVVVEALIAACRHVLHSKAVGPSLLSK